MNRYEETHLNLLPEMQSNSRSIKSLLGLLTAVQSRFTGYAYGPDLSHYNLDVNVQQLVDHGCSFIVHKISDGLQMTTGGVYDPATYKDPSVDERIQQAFEVKRADGGTGIPVVLYHYMRFFGQRKDQLDQLNYLMLNLTKSKIPGKSYHAVVLDIEESNVDSDTNIQEKTEEVYAELLSLGVPILFYTSNNYLETQSHALRDWLGAKDNPKNLWMAQWPWYRRTITWDTFANYVPTDSIKVLTPGFASWKLWQAWGDINGLAGCSNSMDMNWFNGPVSALYSFLNFQTSTPPVEPPPVEPPVEPPATEEYTEEISELFNRIDAIEDRVDAMETWKNAPL